MHYATKSSKKVRDCDNGAEEARNSQRFHVKRFRILLILIHVIVKQAVFA